MASAWATIRGGRWPVCSWSFRICFQSSGATGSIVVGVRRRVVVHLDGVAVVVVLAFGGEGVVGVGVEEHAQLVQQPGQGA
eukprot:12537907-Alexandrium_andersonii.AAC.1